MSSESHAPTVAALVVVAVGVLVQIDAVDWFLSRLFAYALPVAGGLLLLLALAREAWGWVQDWRWMGPPDLTPWRRKREKQAGEREDVES